MGLFRRLLGIGSGSEESSDGGRISASDTSDENVDSEQSVEETEESKESEESEDAPPVAPLRVTRRTIYDARGIRRREQPTTEELSRGLRSGDESASNELPAPKAFYKRNQRTNHVYRPRVRPSEKILGRDSEVSDREDSVSDETASPLTRRRTGRYRRREGAGHGGRRNTGTKNQPTVEDGQEEGPTSQPPIRNDEPAFPEPRTPRHDGRSSSPAQIKDCRSPLTLSAQVQDAPKRDPRRKGQLVDTFRKDVDFQKMTKVEGLRHQARRTLTQLVQAPARPTNTGAAWKERERALNKNIATVINATKKPYNTRGQKGTGGNLATGCAERGSRKRRRIPENTPSDPQDNPLPPLKRPRKYPSKTQIPTELTQLQPQPIQLTYSSFPLEDQTDEWWIKQLSNLFKVMDDFVETYFAVHNLDQGEFHQLWALDWSPRFIEYVQSVAEPDINQGGWDALLRSTNQRKFLIKAVLVKILEYKVFGVSLFGGTEQEKNLFLGLERALISRDGFARQELRAKQARTIIGFNPVTSRFHEEVALLTAQVALMFLPLSNYLYALPPQDPDAKANPSILDQYQQLHNIIGTAGWLSIAMRLSPTIFYMSSAFPGTEWDRDDHFSVDNEAYAASKSVIEKPSLEKRGKWEAAYNKILGEPTKVELNLSSDNELQTDLGSRYYEQLKQAKESPLRPIPPNRNHRALTKIGITPNIRRYKPGSKLDDDAGEPLWNRDGLRIREMLSANTLVYYGLERGPERDGTMVDLNDHIKEVKARFFGEGVAPGWFEWGALGATGAILGLGGLRYFGGDQVAV
ncbi:hypothetical protein B0O99DRAFT_705806 [Bisporella sp. PMI_857]|nr:hypothetical protein B0O99DRAFT_705806 [Bisporella sp. PMI_857]